MTSKKGDASVVLTGQEAQVNPGPVSEGKSKAYRLDAEGFKVGATVRAIGTHVDGHSDAGGCRVDSRPAEGGLAISETAADGSYRGKASGPLLLGEDGEPHAARILAAKLRSLGRDVTELPKEEAENQRGEDRKFLIDGKECVIQITMIPIDALWQGRVRGTGEAAGQLSDAVELLRASFEKKRNKARGTILAVDAAHVARW